MSFQKVKAVDLKSNDVYKPSAGARWYVVVRIKIYNTGHVVIYHRPIIEGVIQDRINSARYDSGRIVEKTVYGLV